METKTPRGPLISALGTTIQKNQNHIHTIINASPPAALRKQQSLQLQHHLPADLTSLSPSPYRSLGIRHRLPIARNTLPIAKRILYIIERQIPLRVTVPPLDRCTPARLTPVLQHLIRQRPYLRQRQIPPRLQIVGKGADPPRPDGDVQLGVAPRGRGVAGYVEAAREVGAQAEGLGGGEADDVLAFGVGCVGGFGAGVDGVAENLDDGL